MWWLLVYVHSKCSAIILVILFYRTFVGQKLVTVLTAKRQVAISIECVVIIALLGAKIKTYISDQQLSLQNTEWPYITAPYGSPEWRPAQRSPAIPWRSPL